MLVTLKYMNIAFQSANSKKAWTLDDTTIMIISNLKWDHASSPSHSNCNTYMARLPRLRHSRVWNEITI